MIIITQSVTYNENEQEWVTKWEIDFDWKLNSVYCVCYECIWVFFSEFFIVNFIPSSVYTLCFVLLISAVAQFLILYTENSTLSIVFFSICLFFFFFRRLSLFSYTTMLNECACFGELAAALWCEYRDSTESLWINKINEHICEVKL